MKVGMVALFIWLCAAGGVASSAGATNAVLETGDSGSSISGSLAAASADRRLERGEQGISPETPFEKKHPQVRAGMVPGFEPYMFQGKDETFQGIIPDYIRLIERHTGIALALVPLRLSDLDDAIGKDVDMFVGVETAERSTRMEFTRPLLSDPWVLVNRIDSPLVIGLRDLKHQNVAVVDGLYIQKAIEADYPEIRIQPAKDHDQALRSVSLGSADAYVGPLAVCGYLILHHRLTNLKIAAPADYPSAQVKFGVRKDWPELVDILNRAISDIPRRQIDAIFQKHVPVHFEKGIDWESVMRWISAVVAVFCALLALSLWWNRKLSLEIKERKTAQRALHQIEWLISKGVSETGSQGVCAKPGYGDISELNTDGIILESVGRETLDQIAEDSLDLLDTSLAVYERNGDYAFGKFSSAWCQMLDGASRRMCDTDDNRKALASGTWLCHESCWQNAAKPTIQSGKATDVMCAGGIGIYAVPIFAGEEVVGAISIGYGDPPADRETVKKLAERFHLSEEEIRKSAGFYLSRPHYIVELAKKRLRTAADLIGGIVQRKRAERALRQSEEKLRAILNNTRQSFVLIDPDRTIQAFNSVADHAARELLGKNIKEGECFSDLVPAKDMESFTTHFNMALAGQTVAVEKKMRRERWYSFSYNPIFSDDATVKGICFNSKEITGRKTAEKELRKFKTVFDNANFGVAIADFDGNIEYVNEYLAYLHGYPIVELLGKNLSTFHTQRQMEKVREIIGRLRTSGQFTAEEVWHAHRSGREFPMLMNGIMVEDDEGAPAYLAATAIDITDRKKAEDALYKSNTLLTAVIRQAPFAAHVLEGEFDRIEGVMENPESVRILGEHVEGRNGIDAGDPEALSCRFFTADGKKEVPLGEMPGPKAFRGESATNEEFLLRHPGGAELFVQASASPVHDAKGEIMAVVVTFHDITERKLAQARLQQYSESLEEMVEERTRELKKAQQELLVKERLAVLGHFAGNISHELRNPLGAVDASAYFLNIKLGGKDEKIDEHLARIRANIQKSTAIIESMLNLSRMEKPTTNPQDMGELVRETIRNCNIPASVEVLFDFPDTILRADMDPEQIRIVLKNIVQNAVQAMGEQGRLTIEIKPSSKGPHAPERSFLSQKPDGEAASTSEQHQSPMVEVRISDTGPGISREHVGKIFEPLFTTKTHGIGFGLSIAKMIVENHGGTIRAESTERAGTTLAVCLPRAE